MRCLFFVLCQFFLLPQSFADQQNSCLNGLRTEPATVERISDGDTIVLKDQRRVRIIGLNTLELNTRYKPDQIWARTAAKRLESMIGEQAVTLAYGSEEFDRHGRTLAHVVLDDGSIAAETLIFEGLALAVTVGANNRCHQEFHSAERNARAMRRGIWHSPGIWFNNKETLNRRDRGFQLVSSQVISIVQSSNKPRLSLSNGLLVKFDEHWTSLKETSSVLSMSLIGKNIELRGWVGNSAGQPSITISHPANLKILAN